MAELNVRAASRWSLRAVALAAAYFVVAILGLRYATIGPSISPVWPPTGLAIAGRRVSPEAVHGTRKVREVLESATVS